jgi:dTDP-4-amino-4,6-dideoxygalactose transaminase
MSMATGRRLGEMAIGGGRPAFAEKLHVGRPNIGDRARLLERINGILDRRWLTNNGCQVQEFEQRVAEIAGVKHCIATCNGAVALEIVIRALDLKGEVIVPAFTFVATAHALQWQEITPVFADIDPATHLLDPESVERMITPRTSAILGVHLWGQGCEVGALEAVARRRGLKLLFDAAHAFGCTHRGRMIGSFGDAEVFSFHATKFVNCLEGGAVVTNDDELARRVRLMKNFGFLGYDKVDYVGTNGKLDEFSAAMGLTSLESMDRFVAANRRNYLLYREGLAGLPGITLLPPEEGERCNHQYVILEIAAGDCPISRDDLLDLLWTENVLARRYFYPGCHRMEPYRSHFPHAGMLLPNTELVASRVLVMPTGETIGAAEIATICEIIRLGVEHAGEVGRRLKECQLEVHPKLRLPDHPAPRRK